MPRCLRALLETTVATVAAALEPVLTVAVNYKESACFLNSSLKNVSFLFLGKCAAHAVEHLPWWAI